MKSMSIFEQYADHQMRLPGRSGVAFELSAALCLPEDASFDVGIDIALITRANQYRYLRRAVQADFVTRLADYFWAMASGPSSVPEPFHDPLAGLTLTPEYISDFTVQLGIQVLDDDLPTGIGLVTTRSALISATNQLREWLEAKPVPASAVDLPVMLFGDEEGCRLTGVYRPGVEISDPNSVFVAQLIQLTTADEGDLAASMLVETLLLPALVMHGVFDDGTPWVAVAQALPAEMPTALGLTWDPIGFARAEVHRVLPRGASVINEVMGTRAQLIELFAESGVPTALVADWSITDLVTAAMAELCMAPVSMVVRGKAIGCALPDIPHDCEQDVFTCVFTNWQRLRLGM